MSRNQFVPPVSSIPSLDLDEEDLRSASTRASLRQASAAIEAAYRRISQVRRSIFELSDAFPLLPESRLRYSNIDPGHQAIILSSDEEFEAGAVEMDRLRSSLPYSVMERIEHHQASLGEDGLSQGADAADSSSPHLYPTPTRRTQLETQIAMRRQQRRLDSDDSSTALGRRVAAREAAGRTSPTEPEMDDISFSRATAEIALELESLTRRVRQSIRRSEFGFPSAVPSPQVSISETESRTESRTSFDLPASGRETQSGPLNQNMNPSSSLPRPLPPSRRWRALQLETRRSSTQSSSSQPDRLSLLSNFSVQNLSTPTSIAPHDRPLLFDEPHSYVPHLDSQRVESMVGADRRYVVRRRTNADGAEHVHNINLDWNDDPLYWLMPQRERLQDDDSASLRGSGRLHRPYQRAQLIDTTRDSRSSTSIAPSSEPPARRRGWARLDADGNEISTDEEEELEQARSQSRLRAQFRAIASSSALSSARDSETAAAAAMRRIDGLLPVTRTSMPDDSTHTAARVRLNSRDTARESSHSICLMESEWMNRMATPFIVNPLPMPLEEMAPQRKQKNRRYTPGIVVSEYASLAGR